MKTSGIPNGFFTIRILFYTSNPVIFVTEHKLQLGFSCIVTFFLNWVWLRISRIIQSSSKFLITNPKQCVFFQLSTSGPTILSTASEINFTGFLPSKLYCTLGILFFCLGLLLQNQGKYWVNSATSMLLTPQNIIIISQIVKVLRSLQKKKKTFSFDRVTQLYILKFSCLFKKEKNLRTIKTILRYLSFAPF